MAVAQGSSEAERAAWLRELLERRGDEVLRRWGDIQLHGSATLGVAAGAQEVHDQAEEVLSALREGLASGRLVPSGPAYAPLRGLLAELSTRGARGGTTPSETAMGVLALREAVVAVARAEVASDSVDMEEALVTVGRLVDALAMTTFETYVRGREEVINRQGQELLELSTPVVRLWDGVVAVPLVGTLDSSRAQVVMETLLQAIVDQQATVAILDITGVPTVDTLVAQHLLKTATATRLMGADCILSGIRPQTAQTVVELGIDLADITTRATLADALEAAIRRVGDDPAAPARRR